MKKALLILFLAGVLTACASAGTPAQTETILPTIALPSTPVPTATLIPVTETPTPVPTDPIIPMITPDAIQVERWKEYQTGLAKRLFSYISPEEILCEWDILKRSDKDVYVWVVCKSIIESSSTPVVIHLKVDGAIQSIEVPGPGLYDYPKMFPPDVQEKFTYYRYGRAKELSDHIDWRWAHPEELPLIILSATQMP